MNRSQRRMFQGLGASVFLHILAVVCLVLVAGRQTERIQQRKRQITINVESQRSEQRQIAWQEEERIAEQMLQDELQQQLEGIVTAELAPEDEAELLARMQASLEERLAQQAAGEVHQLLQAEWDQLRHDLWHEEFDELRERWLTETMQHALLEEVTRYARDEAAPKLRDQIEAQLARRTGEATHDAMQEEMRAFHQQRGAGGKKLDDVDRAMGQAALEGDEIAAALQAAIVEELQATAIPRLSAAVTEKVAAQLEQAGWEPGPFRQRVAEEISAALARQMQDEHQVQAAIALRRAQGSVGLLPAEPIAAAETDVAAAAERLAKLGTHLDGDIAAAELPAQIESAEAQAKESLVAARRASATATERIEAAWRKLASSDAARDTRQAVRARQSGETVNAEKKARSAAKDLDSITEQLNRVAETLAAERAKIESQRAPPPDVELANARGDDQAAAIAAQTAPAQTAQRVATAAASDARDSVRRGANVKVGQPFSAAMRSRLARMANLNAKFDKIEQNMAAGRSELAASSDAEVANVDARPGEAGDGAGSRVKHGYNRYAAINRQAYERYRQMSQQREGKTLENAYGEVAVLEGNVSLADFAHRRERPRLVYARSHSTSVSRTTTSDSGNSVSREARQLIAPRFETLAYGAADFQDRPLKIDGDLSDWGQLNSPLVMQWQHDGRRLDNGIPLYLRWSPVGMFIAYHVPQRGEADIEPPAGKPYEGDVLEVWLDVDNLRQRWMSDSPFTQQFVLMPFGYSGDANKTFAEVGRGFRGISKHAYRFDSASDIDRALGMARAKFERGGYTVEAFISTAALAKERLRAGQYVAMNFSINRGYDYQQHQGWSMAKDAAKSYNRPDTWGDVLLLGSDGTARFTDVRQPGKPPDVIVAGDPVGVEVVDRDMNVDPQRRDRLLAQVQVVGDVSYVYLVLEETEADSGLFRGSFSTQAQFLPPRTNTLNVRGGETLLLQYRDLRAAFGERNRPVDAQMEVGLPVMRFSSASPQR